MWNRDTVVERVCILGQHVWGLLCSNSEPLRATGQPSPKPEPQWAISWTLCDDEVAGTWTEPRVSKGLGPLCPQPRHCIASRLEAGADPERPAGCPSHSSG